MLILLLHSTLTPVRDLLSIRQPAMFYIRQTRCPASGLSMGVLSNNLRSILGLVGSSTLVALLVDGTEQFPPLSFDFRVFAEGPPFL